jgi:hypothetical protein
MTHAIGQNCSARQRLTEQLSTKEAILRSREIHPAEYYDIKNLPEAIQAEVIRNGLGSKQAECQKCLISVPVGLDVAEYICRFLTRVK